MRIEVLMLIFFTASSAHSLCCHWSPSENIKCVCADGSHVAPWQCCGTRKCNVFCCDCTDYCRGLVDWRGYELDDIFDKEYIRAYVVDGKPKIPKGYEMATDEHGNPTCRTFKEKPCHIFSRNLTSNTVEYSCFECVLQKIPNDLKDDGLSIVQAEPELHEIIHHTPIQVENIVRHENILPNGQTAIKITETRREESYERKKRSVLIGGLDRNPEIMHGLEGTILKFKSLDLDNSVSLDAVEVARIFGDVDEDSLELARQVILELDTNKDGAINPVEFDKDLEGVL